MQVIANSSAVWCGVVVPKDLQRVAAAAGDLGDEGEEVVGDSKGVFPDATTGMGAHGVEITQRCNTPRATAAESRQHVLNGQLALGVGMDGIWRHAFH